jgi:acylphosphatase
MSGSPSLERRTVYYSGHVQGVGFRYTTRSIARGHDVTGYVRNLPDGRVELVAEGARPELNAFLAEIRDQMGGYFRNEQNDSGAASGEFSSFEIRH